MYNHKYVSTIHVSGFHSGGQWRVAGVLVEVWSVGRAGIVTIDFEAILIDK